MVDKLFVATRAFIVHDGKVLLIRESSAYDDSSQIGMWDMPGGRLQLGETLLEGLQRETQEEAGVTVRIIESFYVGEWRPVVREEEWQIVGIYYLCEPLTSDVVLSKDHDEHFWMPIKDYKHHPLMDQNIAAIEAYLKRYQ